MEEPDAGSPVMASPVESPEATESVLADEVAEAAPGRVAITPPDGRFDRALSRVTVPMEAEPRVKTAAAIIQVPVNERYQVKEGDHLTRIASKFYGEKEGNRWMNLKRIYEANRGTMRSMNELKVGQVLEIPPLRVVSSGRLTAAPVVQVARTPSPRPSRSAARGYVVKKGDSLWAIAERELGNGSRFGEIARLNDRMLSDEDSLKVGMRLRLPGN